MKSREAETRVLSAEWLPVGTRLGRWEVVSRLGDGGYGTVYAVARAGWPRRRQYALKLARRPDDPRFGSEAQALRRVRHRGVVRRVEEGVWRAGPVGYPYVVMEYVPGASLYAWAEERNPTAREVAELLAQAAEALAAAHRRGVLHRDFKGGNVRVRPDGRLKVLDWGAGWYSGAPPLTSTARLPPGTPPYASPQALRWRLEARRGRGGGRYTYTVADELYAVGVTFYKLLAEEYPPPQLAEGGPGLAPRPLEAVSPRVPEPLAAVVLRLLAFRPEARPGGAGDLARQVRQLLTEADARWDVPLFSWDAGTSSRSLTTQGASDAAGPVAPGQEVALMHARARYMDRMRAGRAARERRRRDESRVVTLRQSGTRPWQPEAWPRRAAWGMGALAAVGLAWTAARPPPHAQVPAGEVFQVERRKMAPPPTLSEAAPSMEAPPFSMPPVLEEDMSPQPSSQSHVSRLPATRPGALTGLKRGAMAAGAAVTLAGCPGAQVRPDAARCTPEAIRCMREQLRLKPGEQFSIFLDERRQERTGSDLFVVDGPIVSVTRREVGRLPLGTRVHGRLWTSGEYVIGHFTRAETPDGKVYPVCFDLGDEGLGKQPDVIQPAEGAITRSGGFLTVVEEFTPPPPAR